MNRFWTGLLMSGVLILPAYADNTANAEAVAKRRCAACHTLTKAVSGARKIPEAERAARLDSFLSSHFAADPVERKAIVDYLLAAAAQ